MIGREFKGDLGRVTGLDPSRPCFRSQDPGSTFRIQSGDAKFVDIIHTDGSTGSASNFGQGLLEQLGDIDFYANDGMRNQPGCGGRFPFIPNPGDNCSHERAYVLFIESIRNQDAFIADACPSLKDFKSGNCEGDRRVVGEGTPTDLPIMGTLFYFKTRDVPPYALLTS